MSKLLEIKRAKQSYAFRTVYETKLSLHDIEEYKEVFAQYGVPSVSKAGAVLDMCRSTPFINDNYIGFTKKTLENSYQSALFSPVDFEHEQSVVLGTIINPELIKGEKEDPFILRVGAVFWKARLEENYIEDLTKVGWSMECLHDDYCFMVGGKYIEKEDAPDEWIENLNAWKTGEPVYSDHQERVALMLGGKDGYVEFNGLGLLVWNTPADKLTRTYLHVANRKRGDNLKTYTQEELEQAIAKVESEKDKEIMKLKDELKELNAKFATLNDNLEKEVIRATEFEKKYTEKVMTERLATRTQVLKDKEYPEKLLEKKAGFIKTASDEEFNAFIEEYEVLAATLKPKQEQQVASETKKELEEMMAALTTSYEENVEGNIHL